MLPPKACMKKSEKIISALVLMAVGILFIILKDSFIGILMTVVGVGLIVLGIMDIFDKNIPQAVIKIVAGLVLIICGWAIVEAVLYILAGILLVLGVLLLYDQVKNRVSCHSLLEKVLAYATPTVCIVIGILLLFQMESMLNFIFIVSGILTVLEGGVLLLAAFIEE